MSRSVVGDMGSRGSSLPGTLQGMWRARIKAELCARGQRGSGLSCPSCRRELGGPERDRDWPKLTQRFSGRLGQGGVGPARPSRLSLLPVPLAA